VEMQISTISKFGLIRISKKAQSIMEKTRLTVMEAWQELELRNSTSKEFKCGDWEVTITSRIKIFIGKKDNNSTNILYF
jgi:hypothetical protein